MKCKKAKPMVEVDEDMEIDTAGWAPRGTREAKLRCSPYIIRCGHIVDGVRFAHGDDGGWIISYADLMELARRASRLRGKAML